MNGDWGTTRPVPINASFNDWANQANKRVQQKRKAQTPTELSAEHKKLVKIFSDFIDKTDMFMATGLGREELASDIDVIRDFLEERTR
jgi:histidyl-tRNA synthetase